MSETHFAKAFRERVRKKIDKRVSGECEECKLPIEYGLLITICKELGDKPVCVELAEKFKDGKASLEEVIISLKNALNEEEKKKVEEIIDYISSYEEEELRSAKKRSKRKRR